ncbi:MAG TPA: GFA family protein, partial [Burkholderiaceae bacterium]
MTTIHHGSCHCGRVKFELTSNLDRVMECNCSICRRQGAIWAGADNAGLRIVEGEADLTLYQFGTMTAKHYFCRHCGVQPFAHPRIDPSLWVVNLRCVDGLDLNSLKVGL